MLTSRELEQKIEKVERFKVRILSDNGRRLRSDASGFADYPYERSAIGSLTVAAWIAARFHRHYKGYAIKVCDTNGGIVHGGKKLVTIRTPHQRLAIVQTPPNVSQAIPLPDPTLSQNNSNVKPNEPTPPEEHVPIRTETMTDEQIKSEIPAEDQSSADLKNCILAILKRHEQPSALELLNQVSQECGLDARWIIHNVVSDMLERESLPWGVGPYLESILSSGDLEKALNGDLIEDEAIKSSIDSLIRKSSAYRHSSAFKEMIEFMARFRNYSPFNNMLVKVQNPSCGFFATEKD